MLNHKILGGAKKAVPFAVNYSLDFTRSGSQYMLRGGFANSDGTKWTFSTWVKRSGSTGNVNHIFASGRDIDDYAYFQFNPSGQIVYFNGIGGGIDGYVLTTSTFTSTSTWYHIVIGFDSTQSSANRVKIYVNGSLQSALAAYAVVPGYFNEAYTHALGVRFRPPSGFDNYLDAKMTEINFVDGQQLSASDFGEDDGGSWVPKYYSGTYGTNGFRLTFEDATSTTTLGYDYSGNDNHWTLYNMTTADQSTDVP